jgi:hypothetical protein
MEHTSGIPLSLTSPSIWKGANKSNGQLALIHNFHLAVSCSALVITAALQAELTAAGEEGVPFGNGVFYDRYIKSTAPNKVWAGHSVAANAVNKLAGVICYDAGLASMQPIANKGVQASNKVKIIKRGFLRYKTGKAAAGGSAIAYSGINDATMLFFIENSTGDPVFAAPTSYGSVTTPAFVTPADLADVVTDLSAKVLQMSGLVPILADCTYAGRIVQLYPEDESVLV